MNRKERINKLKRVQRLQAIRIKQEGPSVLLPEPCFNAHDSQFGCAAKPYVPSIDEVLKTIRRRVYRERTHWVYREFGEDHSSREEVRDRMIDYLQASGRTQYWGILKEIA